MWFGVLYIPADEMGEDDPHDVAVVCVYEPHRVWTLAAPTTMAPTLIRMLREAACETGGVGSPRCETCDEPIDVPPLDGPEAACGSA
jgi:hypothetical protein